VKVKALRRLALPFLTICELVAGRWERRSERPTSPVGRFFRRVAITLRFTKALCGPKRTYDTITIRGSQEFTAATVKALELLKEKTPEAHALVKKYIGEIVSITPSAVFPDLLRLAPTYIFIGPAYSEGSTAEYAGAIAHEAYHCELYVKAQTANPNGAVSPAAYSGEDGEELCLQYQCAVLRKLELEDERIKQYEGRLNSRWWEVPFEQRDW
jgi:hypothetical protein